jgi:hypothetical protein
MSFGPNSTTKRAENNLGGVSNQATELSRTETGHGEGLLNMGQPSVASGTNFFNTLLNGNRANSTALLQPQIDQIRGGTQNQLQAINTLMPRGGGRASSLFNASYMPQQQIQNLFNPLRSQAASALPQIGLQQMGLGTNLFGIGNQPLNTATGASSQLGQFGQADQQMRNQQMAALGSGLVGLATLPFGGGAAAGGLLGMIGGK